MKILGSRQLPCGHHSMRVDRLDVVGSIESGSSARRCRTCKQLFSFVIVPAEEAQRITGDEVFRIEWESVVPA